MATLAQVHALAEAVEPRWRAMILLATFAGLRLGELAGLTHARSCTMESPALRRGELLSGAKRLSDYLAGRPGFLGDDPVVGGGAVRRGGLVVMAFHGYDEQTRR